MGQHTDEQTILATLEEHDEPMTLAALCWYTGLPLWRLIPAFDVLEERGRIVPAAVAPCPPSTWALKKETQ